MLRQVLEEARQRCEPEADGGMLRLLNFTHDAFPGNHGAVAYLAKLFIGADVQRPHEMPRCESVTGVIVCIEQRIDVYAEEDRSIRVVLYFEDFSGAIGIVAFHRRRGEGYVVGSLKEPN